MKYKIDLASGSSGKPPCKNAYQEKLKTDYYDDWYINITNVEQFNGIIEEVGEQLVLSSNRITIYDDYIE